MSSSVPRGRRAARAGSAVAGLVLVAGCGSAPTLDAAAKTSLHDGVDEIRSAAGNLTKAKAAVQQFRADVDRLVNAGDLDAADSKVLLAQVAQLEAQLTADAPPAAVAPAPSPTASPARRADAKPAPVEKDDEKEKPGKAKGNDKKKDARADR